MNIAIIQAGVCVNVAVFEDIKSAKEHLAAGVWPGAELVTEAEEGYGVGDRYDGKAWTKAEAASPEPTAEELLQILLGDDRHG